MAKQRIKDFDKDTNDSDESQDHSEANLSKKLERRRRIEDIIEERKLKAELNEFEF